MPPCANKKCTQKTGCRSNVKYCSNACRQQAHRRRKAANQFHPGTAKITHLTGEFLTTHSKLRVHLEFDRATTNALLRETKSDAKVPALIERLVNDFLARNTHPPATNRRQTPKPPKKPTASKPR